MARSVLPISSLSVGIIIAGTLIIDKDLPSAEPGPRVDWIRGRSHNGRTPPDNFRPRSGRARTQVLECLERDTSGTQRPPLMKLSIMKRTNCCRAAHCILRMGIISLGNSGR